MKSRLVLVTLIAVVALAACGEIVGLGDPPTIEAVDAAVGADGALAPPSLPPEAGAPDAARGDASPPTPTPLLACGIAAGTSACQACMAESCCAPNAACAASHTCESYESCLIPCAGDYACRARCMIANSPVALEAASVNACVADKCSGACGVSCGMTDSFAEPGGATACAECLSANGTACADWQACGSTEECNEVALCAADCTTLDCISACGIGHDAGASSFVATALDSVSCMVPCDVGNYWECVGSFEPTFNHADATVLTLSLAGPTSPAGSGIAVRACPSTFDDQCTAPVATATTDANGNATLVLPVNDAVGFSGYFELSGPTIVSELVFLEFPLSEAAAGMRIPVVAPSEEQNVYDQVNVKIDPTLGYIWAAANDCHWLPSRGVTVQATGEGGPITTTYGADFTSTSVFGAAYLLNAPLGVVSLEVVGPHGIGLVTNGVSIFTRGGTVSYIALHPNVTFAPTPPRKSPTNHR